MANDVERAATMEDINEIHSRFYLTEQALGFIFASLPKDINLDAIFDNAIEAASNLKEDHHRRVHEIIRSIQSGANDARKNSNPDYFDDFINNPVIG